MSALNLSLCRMRQGWTLFSLMREPSQPESQMQQPDRFTAEPIRAMLDTSIGIGLRRLPHWGSSPRLRSFPSSGWVVDNPAALCNAGSIERVSPFRLYPTV